MLFNLYIILVNGFMYDLCFDIMIKWILWKLYYNDEYVFYKISNLLRLDIC